jgi:preprotein translocase subunit SecF
MFKLFETPHIDFIAKRKIAYLFSIGLIMAGVVSLILHNGPNYGIDFKGGTSIVLRFEKDVATADIRDALSKIDLSGSEIKTLGTKNEFLIYVKQIKGMSAAEVARKIEQAVSGSISTPYELRQVDTVGPKIGSELKKAALKAAILSLILIMIYVGWRFDAVFGIAAVIALFHDSFIAFGVLSIFNFEIGMKEIAAFLTIIGYSINDTIVIYDRMRENLKIHRNDDLVAIMNRSINETMSRTIITALTVFFVVLILFLFGGEVNRGFSLAMLVGTIIGCYSTVFVASPLAWEWYKRHGGGKQMRMAKKKT